MMNKILTLLLFCFLFNCNNNSKKTKEVIEEVQQEQEVKLVKEKKAVKPIKQIHNIPFLTDIKTLEQDTSANPIENFKKTATTKANKSIVLTKANIKTALEDAKQYKHTVIVVGTHTIVKVIDYANCKVSASWGACMPYVKGYVKKGGLQPKIDYANNIIGLPDTQERVMYMFN
ncbi:hypothetical protein [Pontimicrobium sp. MEBiC06410]